MALGREVGEGGVLKRNEWKRLSKGVGRGEKVGECRVSRGIWGE